MTPANSISRSRNSRRVAVIGLGYVGLTTAAGLAELGHDVTGVDTDRARVEHLRAGRVPIFEPGLEELVHRNAALNRLRFTGSYREALFGADFAFIAVPTPSTGVGAADLSYVRDAVRALAADADHPLPVVVNKSTVPIGTGDSVETIIASAVPGETIHVVSNPEFTREGTAVHDFLEPDRIVIGSNDAGAAGQVAELYAGTHARMLLTDIRTAEMIKYASNAFLATKISFINEIAAICQVVGADVVSVADGMGLDQRIGRSFLNAGLGFGGSCLPKDVKALAHVGSVYGTHPQLLNAVLQINQDQRRRVVKHLRDALGSLERKRVCLLGLAFKPNTDDTRDAPARDLVQLLAYEGAEIAAYDPAAATLANDYPQLRLADSAYGAAESADAMVLVTEWEEFRGLDPQILREIMLGDVVLDARNFLDGALYEAAGFHYIPTGRPEHVPAEALAE